jgi:hypothetical protein
VGGQIGPTQPAQLSAETKVPVDVEHHQTIGFHAGALDGDPAQRLGIFRARLDQHSYGDRRAAVQTTMAMHQEATVRIERAGKLIDSVQVLRRRKDQARLWAHNVIEPDVQMFSQYRGTSPTKTLMTCVGQALANSPMA